MSLTRLLHRGRGLLVVPALFTLLLFSACATLAPGADPKVVRTEQALEVSLALYDAGMTWCEGHPAKLSAEAAKVAEGIRVGFPLAYRTTDSALQLYKAGKGGDPLKEVDELERIARQLVELVKLAGGPDLTAGGAR